MDDFVWNKQNRFFVFIFVIFLRYTLDYRAIGSFAMNTEIYFLRVKQFTELLTFKNVSFNVQGTIYTRVFFMKTNSATVAPLSTTFSWNLFVSHLYSVLQARPPEKIRKTIHRKWQRIKK